MLVLQDSCLVVRMRFHPRLALQGSNSLPVWLDLQSQSSKRLRYKQSAVYNSIHPKLELAYRSSLEVMLLARHQLQLIHLNKVYSLCHPKFER